MLHSPFHCIEGYEIHFKETFAIHHLVCHFILFTKSFSKFHYKILNLKSEVHVFARFWTRAKIL